MKNWRMTLPRGVETLLCRLTTCGYEAYVVGGCVRDALLGLEPKDYDLCTSALPEQMLEVFRGEKIVQTGRKHGTLTVVQGGVPYEITTYRTDGNYVDHRHPDAVRFVRELRQDQARRDFTVNAMAYHPREGLMDAFNGAEDLKRGVIRCVGEPMKRFDEDALRILRALRFAAVYGFSIEEETACAALAFRESLRYVTKERITAELCKLVCGSGAEAVLTEYEEILRVLFPGATLLPKGLSELPCELPVRLAHLFRATQSVLALRQLRLDQATIRAVTELIENQEQPCPETDSSARKLVHRIGAERAMQLLRWKRWEAPALQRVLSRGDCCAVRDLKIGGRDLLALGVPEGKEIKEILEKILQQVMEESVPNKKERLLEAVEKMQKKKNKGLQTTKKVLN